MITRKDFLRYASGRNFQGISVMEFVLVQPFSRTRGQLSHFLFLCLVFLNPTSQIHVYI